MQPLDKDITKLEKEQLKLGTKQGEIIREQLQVIKACEEGLYKIGKDLVALRERLNAYVSPEGTKAINESYYDLKQKYEFRLKERATLERAHVMAEESIVAAQLYAIPGETV